MHFHDVACLLLEDSITPGECQDDWTACSESRSRSAVSRAYYAVFRELKRELIQARESWVFPQVDAHRKLRIAVQEVLGSTHPLTNHLKVLVRERVKADYDLGKAAITVAEAVDLVDKADLALEQIDGLSNRELEELAFDLSQR